MTNIICDICKKPIPDAVRVYSWEKRYERYDTIKDKDICPDCLFRLDEEIHAELEKKDKFEFHEVKDILNDKLESLSKWQAKARKKVLGKK
jgi:hypothetical protein